MGSESDWRKPSKHIRDLASALDTFEAWHIGQLRSSLKGILERGELSGEESLRKEEGMKEMKYELLFGELVARKHAGHWSAGYDHSTRVTHKEADDLNRCDFEGRGSTKEEAIQGVVAEMTRVISELVSSRDRLEEIIELRTRGDDE